MNGFLQEYGLNIVAVIIVLAFIVFASVFGDTITGGINDITSDFFAKSGVTTDINGDGNDFGFDIVDGNKNGKHYHNDQLFTGTCDGTEYKNGTKIITFVYLGEDNSHNEHYKAEEGMTWKEFIESEYNTNNSFVNQSDVRFYHKDYYSYMKYIYYGNKTIPCELSDVIVDGANYYLTTMYPE